MIVVLIHWRIRPAQKHIDAFLAFWRSSAVVDDRRGLAGEFLSETLTGKDFPYITWDIDADNPGNYKSFVNVGLWADERAFQDQIAVHFNDRKPLLSFEQHRRRRIVLRPRCWRMGDGSLPFHDSGGVV